MIFVVGRILAICSLKSIVRSGRGTAIKHLGDELGETVAIIEHSNYTSTDFIAIGSAFISRRWA